jgi:signal transduction histidine kinase
MAPVTPVTLRTIRSSECESIFEPFQRASNANNEGTGMGLAIVRKAAERMGGHASVESNLAQGSTFWVELRKATQT